MLTRLAACFVSLGLLAGVADATSFATRPGPQPDIVQIDPVTGAPFVMNAAIDRAQVREALAKRRAKNVAAFRAYRKAGTYPHNTFRAGPLNVWIDARGRLCAAATMISNDGKHDLVLETAKTNNQIRLLNVTEGPLLDWILTSGLTIEEIDRIQAPMVYPDGRVELERPLDFAAEDAKLRASYAQTDAWLVKRGKVALDTAVDRLMANPALAKQLVDGTP